MKPFETVELALHYCPPFEAQALADFLGDLLTEDLETMAKMPGSPGQVLAAQFACYARGSVKLAEELRAQDQPYRQLQDTLGRLSASGATRPKRRRASHADPSHPEAHSGR